MHIQVASSEAKQSPGDIYLTAPQVCERYGNITSMTLHRWLRDERMEFPQPDYFGRLRFWKLSILEDWERLAATRRAATKNNQPTN
jgi:hypothetical protein